MKKYKVTFPAVTFEVEAENEKEAITAYEETRTFSEFALPEHIVEEIGEVEDTESCIYNHDHAAEPDKCEWHN